MSYTNDVKSSIKCEKNHVKHYDFQNLLKINNTMSKSRLFSDEMSII